MDCVIDLSCVFWPANLKEVSKEEGGREGGPMADRFRLVSSFPCVIAATSVGVAVILGRPKIDWFCIPLSKGENIPPPAAANWEWMTLPGWLLETEGGTEWATVSSGVVLSVGAMAAVTLCIGVMSCASRGLKMPVDVS